MELSSFLLLIAAQIIWASSYIAMKIGLETLSPEMVVFLRYFFVFIFFIPFWCIRGFPKLNRKIILGSLVVGIANFYGSQMLQVNSLKFTQATDVSIIVLMEPMLTMFLAFLILKERISKNLLIILLISMVGFFLISDIHFSAAAYQFTKLRLLGNSLFFAAIFFEALCSVTGKYFTSKNKPWDAMGLLMMAGFLFCFVVHCREITSYDYTSVPIKAWASILFLSIGCSIFAYCTWYVVISKVPVQYAALSLFIQPMVGSFLGYFVFHEKITTKTCVGALIICLSLLWWQYQSRNKKILNP